MQNRSYYCILCESQVVIYISIIGCMYCFFFFQAEDGIRDLVRSRGLGDVYKRQILAADVPAALSRLTAAIDAEKISSPVENENEDTDCLLYTSDAADERSSVDLGGRRILKKKKRA